MANELKVSDVDVRYGRATAVSGVEITARGGTVTAVVGPNGAGKSSLLLAIYGSVPAKARISIDADDLSALSALERARKGLMIVPQGRQLFPRLSVRENLALMAELLGLRKDSVEEALQRFPVLSERANSFAGVLSGGEQQMLVVTRALMAKPKVLLLDEMMTGLAPLIVDRLLETLNGLLSEGVAVVIADPAIGPFMDIIDRGYVLVRGRVVHAVEGGGPALDTAYRSAVIETL